jgi:hypothetical protein
MLETWEQVFSGDGGDYMFTMSHISIQGRGVEVRIEGGEWVLTQRMDNGGVWTARSDDMVSAVLLLIAGRSGNASVNGTIDYAPATAEEPT